MAKAIHTLSITDNDWHDVSRRFPCVQAQILKLRMEVLGVFPELRAQFRLSRAELERFENSRDYHRWKRARVHVRMRVETQILQRLFRTGDESSQSSKCIGECSVKERDTIFHAKLLGGPTPMFAARKHRVRFIDENARTVRFCDVE